MDTVKVVIAGGREHWGEVEESLRGISGDRVLTGDGEYTLQYADDVL